MDDMKWFWTGIYKLDTPIHPTENILSSSTLTLSKKNISEQKRVTLRGQHLSLNVMISVEEWRELLHNKDSQ